MGTFNIGNIPVAPIITYGGADDLLHETVNGVYKIKNLLTEFVIPDEITEIGDYALLCGLQADSSSLTKINFNNVKICGKSSVKSFTNGNFENLSTVEFPNLQKCGDHCFYEAFAEKGSLAEVNFPELVSIGDNCFYRCFAYDPIITISFPKIEEAPSHCFHGAFSYCKSLVEVDFPVLNSTSNNSFEGAFSTCTSLKSISFPVLSSAGSSSFYSAFSSCTSLESISFPALNEMKYNSCFYNAFSKCTSLRSISFPALNTSSFGKYKNQFTNMLSGVTGCNVHFPASIESTISSWTSVRSGFNGTNTVVFFDL